MAHIRPKTADIALMSCSNRHRASTTYRQRSASPEDDDGTTARGACGDRVLRAGEGESPGGQGGGASRAGEAPAREARSVPAGAPGLRAQEDAPLRKPREGDRPALAERH